MAIDPITGIMNLIDKGLDKFVMDKGQKEKLSADMRLFALQEATKQDGIFRDFIVKYEGAAKEVPKLIVYLRSLIRPLFTIMIGYIDFQFFVGTESAIWSPEKMGLLKAINVIILFFWFGERAVTNSGVVGKLAEVFGKKQ